MDTAVDLSALVSKAPAAPPVQGAARFPLPISEQARTLVGEAVARHSLGERFEWDTWIALVPTPNGIQPAGAIYLAVANPILGQPPLGVLQLLDHPAGLTSRETVEGVVQNSVSAILAARDQAIKS